MGNNTEKKKRARRHGAKGIRSVRYKDGSEAYQVRCRDHEGQTVYLGTFSTLEDAARVREDYLLARKEVRRGNIVPPDARRTFGDLIDVWAKTLTNRSQYDDRLRINRHLKPYFGEMKIIEMESLPVIMRYIDHKRAEGRIKDPTIRHTLNLLSRFFNWAVARAYARWNPISAIPKHERPQQTPKTDRPWLDTDEKVLAIFRELPRPWNIKFLIGITTGFRNGEISGLRVADCRFDESCFHASHSYDGILKEAKPDKPKVKIAPMTEDVQVLLHHWITTARADAGSEDVVFPDERGKCRRDARQFARVFNDVKKKLSLPDDMSWYPATRHSFASRKLAEGVPLDVVSRALGHASPLTTRRYYDQFVQRTFSGHMVAPILSAEDRRRAVSGEVIPITRPPKKSAG